MFSLSPATVSTFLSTLRTLPVWVLGGLALIGYAILFAPAFGGIELAAFRAQWGVAAWIWAVSFSILAVTRSIDAGVTTYRMSRKAVETRRALRLVPHHHQCWWHLAKQQDDSFCSQIRMDVEAANLTDHPVRIVKAGLIRPRSRGELLHADVMLPEEGCLYHSSKHAVPARGTVTASLHIMLRGALGAQGKPLRATLRIIDQFGDEYRLKHIVIPTRDPLLPARPWPTRLALRLRKLTAFRAAKAPESGVAFVRPPEWELARKFEEADLILNEERRNYAACGRNRGGLGSLNVGLQSEPNFGWTTVGTVPSLLWDKAQAKPIESPNIVRLMRMHAALDDSSKNDLERYLLSHLHKASPYSDVSYFTFLALHRMSRTVDALRMARTNVVGDKVYGYSNLLGTLSAIVSREHFDIDPALYPRILEVLAGDAEDNFRLSEKINLARLQHLDTKATPDS